MAPLSALTPLSTSPAVAASMDSTKDQPPVIDCVVTPWFEWSPCSHTCGNGRRERRRMIKLNPENGGKPCPARLVQRRECKDNAPCPPLSALTPLSTSPAVAASMDSTKDQPPVIDCVVTQWPEWSPCSHTCGNGRRERRRMIKLNPENGGKPCPAKLVQRRKCKDNAPCRSAVTTPSLTTTELSPQLPFAVTQTNYSSSTETDKNVDATIGSSFTYGIFAVVIASVALIAVAGMWIFRKRLTITAAKISIQNSVQKRNCEENNM
ncbi:hypothetical protein JTE90_025220 [Oedothorax gibbosus]|uniref:Spondin-like TSP1 domain-containing protein n=1 Tax=Oedothorax gibbosus TaxID=931172 RepID=A0AAV6UVA3_9ARAC|nr:hypothetical protein JTE90_025220 [Oedothorax gibbosus]